MTIFLRSLITGLTLICMSFFAASQIETVATFPRYTYSPSWQPSMVGTQQNYGTQQLVLFKQGFIGQWWKADLSGGQTTSFDVLNAHIDMSYAPVFNAVGAFFLTKNNGGQYFIEFLGVDGQQSTTGVIGTAQIATSRSLLLLNEKVLCCLQNGAQYHVVESDGTPQGTQVVYASSEPIVSLSIVNNAAVIARVSGTDLQLLKYEPGLGVTSFSAIPGIVTSYKTFTPIGHDAFSSFFSVYMGPQRSAVWKTDLTTAGTQLFIDSISAGKILFRDSTFFLSTYTDRLQLQKGTADDPENLVPLPYAPNLQGQETDLFETYGDYHYFRTLTFPFGIELAQISDDDTIRLVRDLAPGVVSSLPGHLDDFIGYSVADGHCFDSAGWMYTTMTNGGDAYRYCYRVKDGIMESLFPIDTGSRIAGLFETGGYLYWFRPEGDSVLLERFDLSQPFTAQPEPVPEPFLLETWFRQLALPEPDHFWGVNEYNPSASSDIHIDLDGNVLIATDVRNGQFATLLSSEQTPIPYTQDGATILARYDRYGKLLWTTRLGDWEMLLRIHARVGFCHNGDIVVAGNYYLKGYFGEDTLTAPGSGYYLARLDGTTGEPLWYKNISEDAYTDKIEFEGITLDEQDHIYLALNYRNFNAVIDGMPVSAMISPVNAVARFSPEGTIEWLKNIAAPWMNTAGDTRFFAFDTLHDQMIAVQSQGFYNTSSSCMYHDWGYFVQTLDPDGTLKDTFMIMGDDLGGLTSGFIGSDGSFNGFGYYRGNLYPGIYASESPMGTGCHTFEGFGLGYTSGLREVTHLQTSMEEFFPLDAHVYDGYMYVYGTDANNELTLIKFDPDGQEIGYKQLGQKADPFDFGFYQYFDVRDGYIVFLGDNFTENQAYDVHPVIPYTRSKAILKIRDEDWLTDKTWFATIELPAYEGEELVIYPNPFTESITVVFPGTSHSYSNYEVSDMNGRKTAEGKLSEMGFQELLLEGLGAGMYLIRFSGGGQELTERIVKVNN